jgi:hypothetical protein
MVTRVEPHLPHIENGQLIVPGLDGSGTLTFSNYRSNADGTLCGAYTVSYRNESLQATWHVLADDYLSLQLHEFVDACANRHGVRFEESWTNIMGDITMLVRCDGLGHFVLTAENWHATSDASWFARGPIRLDTASMIELARQLRVFTLKT